MQELAEKREKGGKHSWRPGDTVVAVVPQGQWYCGGSGTVVIQQIEQKGNVGWNPNGRKRSRQTCVQTNLLCRIFLCFKQYSFLWRLFLLFLLCCFLFCVQACLFCCTPCRYCPEYPCPWWGSSVSGNARCTGDGAPCAAAPGCTIAAGCSRRWGSRAPRQEWWPGSKRWGWMSCQSPLGPALWQPRCPALGRGLVLGLAERKGASNTASAAPGTAAEAQPRWGSGKEKWDSPGPAPSVDVVILLCVSLGDCGQCGAVGRSSWGWHSPAWLALVTAEGQ